MLVVTSCVHEAGHAWAAWRLGDRRDYIEKRKTPFSLSHISFIFTILLPSIMLLTVGLMMGGARPVQVRTALGPARMALVALAGPMGNFFVGVLAMAALAGLVHAEWVTATLLFDHYYAFALQAVMLNFLLGILNLIPVPPFDGSRIVAVFLPERIRRIYYGFSLPFIGILAAFFLLSYFVFQKEMIRAYMAVLQWTHNGVLEMRDWIA